MLFGGPDFISMFPFQGLFRLDGTTGNVLPNSILGTCFLCNVALLIETVCCFYSVVLPDSTIPPAVEKNSLFFYFLYVYTQPLHKGHSRYRGLFSLPQGIEEKLQPIDLDFVDCLQHLSQFACGKAFLGEPDHIGFRQVDKQQPSMLAEGHARPGQFKQFIRIE